MLDFNEAREREVFDRMHIRMNGPKGGFTRWSIFNEIEKAAAWKAWLARAAMAEGGPDFTATARSALLWALFHHQGFNSPVGVPIRYALGLGATEELTDAQIADARRWADIWNAPDADGVEPAAEPNSPAVQKAMVRFYRKRAEVLLSDYRHALQSGDGDKAQRAYDALLALAEGAAGVLGRDGETNGGKTPMTGGEQ